MFRASFGFEIAPMLHDKAANYAKARSTLVFAGFLVFFPIQFVQFGIAQPAHIWAAIAFIYIARDIRVSKIECYVFLVFLASALLNTVFEGYPRVKSAEQIIKFVLVYPAFFLVGRWLGSRFRHHNLPYGYLGLLAFVIIEWLTQVLQVPILYQFVEFGQDAIHGTFKERNWFALFPFFLGYLLYLKNTSRLWSPLAFFGIMLLVTYLSGSKTILVACGIVILFHTPGKAWLKGALLIGGGLFYFAWFSSELSGDLLNVRLEEERGLAFAEGVNLVSSNPFGYGLGFVESYFSSLPIEIRGLGEGVNSVFCAPLDLWIIGGPVGLAFWAVFFLGLGTGALPLLAPVAALSLLNPLHQSEIVYFFCGFLISWRNLKEKDTGYLTLFAKRAVAG
jgi:hypothetical protein